MPRVNESIAHNQSAVRGSKSWATLEIFKRCNNAFIQKAQKDNI